MTALWSISGRSMLWFCCAEWEICCCLFLGEFVLQECMTTSWTHIFNWHPPHVQCTHQSTHTHTHTHTQSYVVLYNLENGQKHSEKQLESERGVSFLRHILPLQDGASVVCSSGKDVHIIPCQLKLKTDWHWSTYHPPSPLVWHVLFWYVSQIHFILTKSW